MEPATLVPHEDTSATTTIEGPKKRAKTEALSQVEKGALDDIIKYLKSHKAEILYCQAYLNSGGATAELNKALNINPHGSDALAGKDRFHATLTSFRSLPKYWIAEWMVKHCNFASSFVDLLDSQPNQLRQVFGLFTGLQEQAWWPPVLHRIEVLEDYCMWAGGQLGSRWQNFERNVSASGKVDWASSCPFRFEWSDASHALGKHITKVIHRSSKTEVMVTDVVITSSFELLCPWDDVRCQFKPPEKRRVAPIISEFFPENEAWLVMQSKVGIKSKCAELELALRERETRLAKAQGPILHTAREHAASRAKEALKKRAPPTKIATPLIVPADEVAEIATGST